MEVRLARGSNFSSHAVNLGGAIVRNNVNVSLDSEGVECTLNGLSLVFDKQLIDNHTFIDHAMPHGTSHELYKAIVGEAGRNVFNGKILVREDAQKTDAKQTNKNLLLSAEAQVNAKPQLEIYADDVKCTHGATIGQLDDEMIFYLRSRGIPMAQTRALLTYGFASDVLKNIKVDLLKRQIEALLHTRLAAGLPQEEA
jgi:Fe-S cluster assembly protein SufD